MSVFSPCCRINLDLSPSTQASVCGLIIGCGCRTMTIHPSVRLNGVISLVNCMKCGKEIDAGKEVKKGWITKKAYHGECAK